MTTTKHGPYQGRAARAVDLVALLADQVPLRHPARATVRELQKLFPNKVVDIRVLLERVPGKSLAEKGERIGIPRGSLWAIWHGKFTPSHELIEKIKAAGEESADAK